MKRITTPDQVSPGDIILVHYSTDARHVEGLRFGFAPYRVRSDHANAHRSSTQFPATDQFGRFDWIEPETDEVYLLAPAPVNREYAYHIGRSQRAQVARRSWKLAP
jgi:hypothetical protein